LTEASINFAIAIVDPSEARLHACCAGFLSFFSFIFQLKCIRSLLEVMAGGVRLMLGIVCVFKRENCDFLHAMLDNYKV